MDSGPRIKAIPTTHFGITFRSRLEIRWWRVFTNLEIPCEYEKYLVETPAGAYLPDFYFPDQQIWVEIKPYFVHDYRHQALIIQSKHPVIIVIGDIPTAYDAREPKQYIKLGVFKAWEPDGKLAQEYCLGYNREGDLVIARNVLHRDHPKILAIYNYGRNYSFPKPKLGGVKR